MKKIVSYEEILEITRVFDEYKNEIQSSFNKMYDDLDTMIKDAKKKFGKTAVKKIDKYLYDKTELPTEYSEYKKQITDLLKNQDYRMNKIYKDVYSKYGKDISKGVKERIRFHNWTNL